MLYAKVFGIGTEWDVDSGEVVSRIMCIIWSSVGFVLWTMQLFVLMPLLECIFIAIAPVDAESLIHIYLFPGHRIARHYRAADGIMLSTARTRICPWKSHVIWRLWNLLQVFESRIFDTSCMPVLCSVVSSCEHCFYGDDRIAAASGHNFKERRSAKCCWCLTTQ